MMVAMKVVMIDVILVDWMVVKKADWRAVMRAVMTVGD